MSKITISVEVSKETHEVGTLVSDLLKAIKAKKPIVQIAAEELPALAKAIDGIEQLPAEMKEDKAAFMKAVMNPLSDGIAALMEPAIPQA
jgi:hypothetical protein